jgi:RsiW-degrading membrane proteinase PrsW (M82 family)
MTLFGNNEPAITLFVLIACILVTAHLHTFGYRIKVRQMLIFTTVIAILLGAIVSLSRS